MSNNFINKSLQGNIASHQESVNSGQRASALPEIVQRQSQDNSVNYKTAGLDSKDNNGGVSLTNLLTNINVQKKYSSSNFNQ